LPTNEEWEYVAYDADGRRYPWGDEPDNMRVNSHEGDRETTTPVGRYAEHGDASPYRVHDLLGNVWEWTNYHEYWDGSANYDIWHDYYQLRGGSFTTTLLERQGRWRGNWPEHTRWEPEGYGNMMYMNMTPVMGRTPMWDFASSVISIRNAVW